MMVIDGLIYLGRSHFGFELEPPKALEQLRLAGADAAVAVPVHPHGAGFTAANDVVIEAARAEPRFLPMARIDPWADGAEAELTRAIGAGARGLFLHPSEERFRINDEPLVRPLVERAAELDVPVMIAAGFHLFAEPLQLGDAAAWVPGTPVVLTNGGQFNISGGSQFDVELVLSERPNTYIHTTAMYRQDFLERVVSLRGPDRLIFATGAPLFTMAFERARADFAHFDAAERELVMGGNAARIFGIKQ